MDSWTKLRKFLGHVVFNESLNGPKIALNIMNEAKNFLNDKYRHLLHSIQFKKFAFESEPYSPRHHIRPDKHQILNRYSL